ncbi:hypothetical protein ACWE42_04230 [Sutcliffiella cohnii]
MMKNVINILIVLLYCLPFVYFSMRQDFTNGSMLGYILMIALSSILAFFSRLNKSIITFIVGNILSTIISFYFVGQMAGNERWYSYFKPLTPYQLLLIVTILNLIPQMVAMMVARKLRKMIRKIRTLPLGRL